MLSRMGVNGSQGSTLCMAHASGSCWLGLPAVSARGSQTFASPRRQMQMFWSPLTYDSVARSADDYSSETKSTTSFGLSVWKARGH